MSSMIHENTNISIYNQIDILLFSFLMLTFLLIYYCKNTPRKDLSTKLFIVVLVTSMTINLLAALAWVPNLIDEPWARAMNYWSNAIFIGFNFVPIIAWLVYIDYKLHGDEDGLKKRLKLYGIPVCLAVAMMVVNHFTGWVFTIEEGNAYTRQLGVYINGALVYILLFVLFIISRNYKKHISGQLLQVIFCFFTLPIIGGIVQLAFFGLTLTWPMCALATMMAFVLIERDALIKDPLTGLSTRAQLEHRIKHKLKRREPFSLMLMDLDDFKRINDLYGHDKGDETLIVVSSIMEKSVKRSDMVCRYGGDEFLILIESDEPDAGRLVQDRIEFELKYFNAKEIEPYSINMSFGVKFYDDFKYISNKSILADVDRRMYQDKGSKK